MCYYFYKWSDMNSWWTIKQIKASHRLTFTYLEHHEDLGVRSCKDPELPINALGTTLINLVNLLKICSNHQWHQKNVVVLVLRKKKKICVWTWTVFELHVWEIFFLSSLKQQIWVEIIFGGQSSLISHSWLRTFHPIRTNTCLDWHSLDTVMRNRGSNTFRC